MHDIRRVLRIAAARLWVGGLLRSLVLFLTVALVGAFVTRLVQQLISATLPWQQIAIWTAVGVGAAALIWSLLFRERRDAVARRVDDGAQLRESISTALCVERNDDPWSRATVQSAGEKARSVRVRQAVPISAPRMLPVPMAIAVALLILWIAMPRYDLAGWQAKANDKQQEQARIEQVKQQKKNIEDLEARVNKLNPNDGVGEKDPPKPENPKPSTPEQMVKVQVNKLANLAKKLNDIKNGEKGQTMDALHDALRRLKQPGDELAELTRAMATGNFKAAADELDKLRRKLESGELSAEQKAALQKQMADLADQLNKLAQDRKALEDQLAQMGLNKSLASNPQALQQAIQNAKNLTAQQKQQLSKMAQAMNNACSACQNMGGSMSQMAQAMQQGKGMQQGMQGMQGQLSQMEMMSQELAEAEALSGQCQSQLASLAKFSDSKCQGMGAACQGMGKNAGTSPWSSGWSQKQGNGSGGPGRGRGGNTGAQKANEKWSTQKFLGKMGDGPIIGTRFVEGEGIKNESKAQFAAAVKAAEGVASEEIDNNVIPREYHEIVKHYFGRLKAKTTPEDAGSQTNKSDDGAGSDTSDKSSTDGGDKGEG